MNPQPTHLQIRTAMILGIQLDEFDYRLLLREYHRDLRQRHPFEGFPAYSPLIVLDTLMPRQEPLCQQHEVGGRYLALRDFTHRHHRMHLSLAGSDYGRLERRTSPYSIDRTAYFIGREVGAAVVTMDYPGYSPYRSARSLNIEVLRSHPEALLDVLPDYLWWELHDQLDMMRNMVAPEKLRDVRMLIERAGFKLDHFGCYLANFEFMLTDPQQGFEL